MLSHTAGFFSTAAETCPVIGAELVCKALATADKRVSSLLPGPTPAVKKMHYLKENAECAEQAHGLQQPVFLCSIGICLKLSQVKA